MTYEQTRHRTTLRRRHFFAGRAHLGAKMLAVQVDHRLLGDQTDPNHEWLVVLAIRQQPLLRLDKRLLQNVFWIDAPDQSRVETELHHARQSGTVVLEQLANGGVITTTQGQFERGILRVNTGVHSQATIAAWTIEWTPAS